MPHGPRVNKLNLAGQVILAIVIALLGLRITGWIWTSLGAGNIFELLFEGKNESGMTVNYFSYKWVVDVGLAGIVGVGLYFKYSGRVWCRFFCPLAALMHIYARFSRFRIFAEKKKCISCNVCTSVCHQGIDIMSFANKGIPMQDPECVRCSACVQSCPTGVLSFGRTGRAGLPILDQLSARHH
jgi:polyferredoxin